MVEPNAEMARYWNEVAGPRWVRNQEVLDREIAALGRLAIERSGAGQGEAVLDIGCGCGSTTLALGERVGKRGRVQGVDLSRAMLVRARERAAAAGLAHVSFREADAQTASFESGGYDLLFSRFGVMFFSDPAAAFANLRRALRSGGRVTFVCWQKLADNPWMLVPLTVLGKYVPLPPPPPAGAPGPFAFADPERVSGLLLAAGFSDVAFEDVREPFALGGGRLDDAVEFALEVGPAANALRESGGGEELRAQAAAAIRRALEPFVAKGRLEMPSAAWIVSSRRAG